MPIKGEFFQNPGGGGAFYGYQIPFSARFDNASASYINVTQGTPTDVKKELLVFGLNEEI